ncbi:hypothetical protein Ga0080574_TMP4416 [Salipiger abyssi]|uniref:Uncharacterized protein n=1 Tax=Salipiger abyssi TaxID=1250539 RepID=A0A1P8UZC2_9RHOB|nr:hypothetical protein Ga0080574_TMP4416 [Salipiger abyssi]
MHDLSCAQMAAIRADHAPAGVKTVLRPPPACPAGGFAAHQR